MSRNQDPTIKLKPETKKLLDGYKKDPRQTYDSIINWLIKLAETTKP